MTGLRLGRGGSQVDIPKGMQRFRDALRRRGPGPLAGMAWAALRRQGPAGVLRMASDGQPFESVAPTSRRAAPAWPPVLGPGGALAASVWDRWLVQTPSVPADAVLPDDVQLFLQPGDKPSDRLNGAIREALKDGVQVVTFDVLHRDRDKVSLLLAPGASLPALQEDDRHYRRGAATGAFGAAYPGEDLRAAIAAWAEDRSPEAVRTGWRHLDLPLAETIEAWSPPACPPGPAILVARAAGPGASAIICTKDKGHLTRQLVRQLLRLGDDQLAEVIILANGTTNPNALQTLAELSGDPRVQVLQRPDPFNFSRLCNAGVAASRSNGPLLFLNDDIAPVSEGWLAAMTARLAQPGTGAVGPLLLYPDERVQHAGVYLRLPDGAGHVLRGAQLPEGDPLGLAASAREVSCLTGAALLVDREVFRQVGGFDEALALSFQDLDLCLKLREAGRRNVLEPRAVLLHMESATLGLGGDPAKALLRHQERVLFADRWGALYPKDPFHPAMLDLSDESALRLRRPA